MQHWTFAQNLIELDKVSSKFCQIAIESFQNGQSFITSQQRGEISPNLATLPDVGIKSSPNL